MRFKFPKIPKLPHLPHLSIPKLPPFLPHFKLKKAKKVIPFILKHKFFFITTVSIIVFIALAMWYRGYLLSQMRLAEKSRETVVYISPTDTPFPTAIPSPTGTKKSVLGTSDYSGSSDNVYIPPPTLAPLPTFPPIPTLIPMPTTAPPSTNNSQSTNNTGNPNCNTGSGVPNSWYSDVYPNPPISTNTGSVQIVVTLRDCSVQTAPVSDTLKISLSNGDPNTKINGNSLPYTIATSNGNASFEVSSLVAGTVTLVVEDTSRSFTVTDINNHNPTITFASSSNSSGNSNCTTGTGVANSWYSDVYPVSPVSANAGASVTFTVVIRDCNKNNVSSTENLTISQTSNDSGLTVNGSAPPVNIQAQNGQASFSVISQNAGTVNLSVRDTTSSFNITDANNHNPSVVFSGSSATAPTSSPSLTPASTSSPTSSPTNAPTAIPSQTATSTPAPTASNSPTPIPTPIPTRP